MADQVDLVNRDPNNINAHLKATFEDVFAEPDGTHSIDCVWKLAFTCFNMCKGFWYKLLTLFCGCCMACEWGFIFAIEIFNQVWILTPHLRLLSIQCAPIQKLWTIYLQCCVGPCCDACGMILNNVRVTHVYLLSFIWIGSRRPSRQIWKGLYYVHLGEFYRVFPKEQILVLKLDDCKINYD
ncbi:CAV1-like protein, partial [Mya arenaria]